MFFYEGMSCPVCGRRFIDGEDVVSCPTCGAPHHRACWMTEGHCHFADLHGTAEQWTRDEAQTSEPTPTDSDKQRCPHCGAENSPFAEFCGHCGRSIDGRDWASDDEEDEEDEPAPSPFREYAPYRMPQADRFGGVAKDKLIDGVTAEDLSLVVQQNTPYYMPRFAKMADENSPIQFNWVAFLFTPWWLMFRKNYLFGILTLLFSLIQAAVTAYIQIVKLQLLNFTSAAELYDRIYNIMNSGDPSARYLYVLSGIGIVSLLISLLFGLFANRLYMQTCLRRVRRAKEQSPATYKAQLQTVGGVSVGLLMLAALVTYFGPTIMEVLVTNVK